MERLRQLATIIVASAAFVGGASSCGAPRAAEQTPRAQKAATPCESGQSTGPIVRRTAPGTTDPERSDHPPEASEPTPSDGLGAGPDLLAGATGAWVLGLDGASTTGSARFVAEASGKETVTCAVPTLSHVRADAWADRLVLTGLQCHGCASGIPTVTVIDPNGSIAASWYGDTAVDGEYFGARFAKWGTTEVVAFSDEHRGVFLQDSPGSDSVSVHEKTISRLPRRICSLGKDPIGLTDDSPADAQGTPSFRVSRLDADSLMTTDSALPNPVLTTKGQFPIVVCEDHGVSVVDLAGGGTDEWTPDLGWHHQPPAFDIGTRQLIQDQPRPVATEGDLLWALSARGWTRVNGQATPLLTVASSAELVAVLDTRSSNPQVVFTRI